MLNVCKLVSGAWTMLLGAAVVIAMAMAAPAETASPQAFLDGIYKPYLSKNSKGTSLSNDAEIRRYFAATLADAIIKDFAAAHKANDVPMLGSDSFIDAQDWEISDLKIAVKTTGAKTAVATVTHRNFKETRTVTLDLVNTAAGSPRYGARAGRCASSTS